jgi:hypothetical protein
VRARAAEAALAAGASRDEVVARVTEGIEVLGDLNATEQMKKHYAQVLLSRLLAIGLLLALWRARLGLVPQPADGWRWRAPELRAVARIGLPGAAENAAYRLAFLVSVAVVGQMGAAALATHAYAQQVIMVVLLFGLATGLSVEVIVGHRVGAGRLHEAHALVIGNSAYGGSNRLANPVNDDRAMTAKLRALGFKVTEIRDAGREQMVRGLAEFSRTAARADLTLLFYAGHGVQIAGANYMIPVDMSLSDPGQAALQAVSINQAVEQFMQLYYRTVMGLA